MTNAKDGASPALPVYEWPPTSMERDVELLKRQMELLLIQHPQVDEKVAHRLDHRDHKNEEDSMTTKQLERKDWNYHKLNHRLDPKESCRWCYQNREALEAPPAG